MLKKCKYLLLLFVGLICFINFSNAGSVTYTGHLSFTNFEDYSTSYLFYFGLPNTNEILNSPVDVDCYFYNISDPNSDFKAKTYGQKFNGTSIGRIVDSTATDIKNNNYHYTNQINNLFGFGLTNSVAGFTNSFDYSCTFSGIIIHGASCPECEQCPEIDTGSILSGSCDINYCVENGLCPTGTGSRSELVINDIVHEGKPLININIPDYIQWDYAVDENQYDIYVGSGYDQDYIDSVLKINSYRPDNKDFTQIFVSGLTLIFPYIFVALLIVFIWKLLKRIFR